MKKHNLALSIQSGTSLCVKETKQIYNIVSAINTCETKNFDQYRVGTRRLTDNINLINLLLYYQNEKSWYMSLSGS